MRIAFDLDDTLIPGPDSAMAVERLGVLSRLISNEPLRAGTPVLLRALRRRGHDIWLYTTSFRSPLRLRLLFASFGVRLGGIVNQARHDAVLRTAPSRSSKYPPAFGIELLIDDSEGVRLEGERLGFSVLQIDADDVSWCARVELAIRAAERAQIRRA